MMKEKTIRIARLTSSHRCPTRRHVNILNLPDWTILRIAEGSYAYEITASYDVPSLA